MQRKRDKSNVWTPKYSAKEFLMTAILDIGSRKRAFRFVFLNKDLQAKRDFDNDFKQNKTFSCFYKEFFRTFQSSTTACRYG